MESIALLSNSRDNGFTGVNLYCDDEVRPSATSALLLPSVEYCRDCSGNNLLCAGMKVQPPASLAVSLHHTSDATVLSAGLFCGCATKPQGLRNRLLLWQADAGMSSDGFSILRCTFLKHFFT